MTREIYRDRPIEESPRVLVTGASGFLGKYVVDEFSGHGYEVFASGRNQAALDRLESPDITKIPASLEALSHEELPVDVVIHSAALSSAWGSWKDFYESNVRGTEHMIDFSEKNDVKRFVFVSSPSIYSEARDRLLVQEEDADPANRLNYYIRTKIMAEHALQGAYADGRLQELVILRPRGLLGVGDPSMIPRLMAAEQKIGIPIFNNGENVVDLTCVENVAHALRLAAETDREYAQGDVYNITNGEPRTFKSILDEFYDAIGKEPRYTAMNLSVAKSLARVLETLYRLSPTSAEPPLTRYTVNTLGYSQTLDITKARNNLGYEPIMTLSEGIARYAASQRRGNG